MCGGPGDWAEGWNLPRLRTVMGLHYGFTAPTQCIKYLLGSHDQVCAQKACFTGTPREHGCVNEGMQKRRASPFVFAARLLVCACIEMRLDEH